MLLWIIWDIGFFLRVVVGVVVGVVFQVGVVVDYGEVVIFGVVFVFIVFYLCLGDLLGGCSDLWCWGDFDGNCCFCVVGKGCGNCSCLCSWGVGEF